MEHPKPEQDVGSSVPVLAIVATVVALAVIVGGFLTYRSFSREKAHGEIVIAAGSPSGTYYALGEALGRVLVAQGVAKSVRVLDRRLFTFGWGSPCPGRPVLKSPG